jgi:UDPglucose 6-dehydrogenase
MRIAVVGCGYVGLVTGACFAEIGHDVVCVDHDAEKIAALKNGISPIYENFLPELLRRHHGDCLTFTTSTADAVSSCAVVFIAVATPSGEDGAADLSCVEAAVAEIARSVDRFKVIVQKSTVPVSSGEWVHELLTSHGVRRSHFEVVSNPEFLREGTAVTDFLYGDRIVIGSESPKAAKIMREIYAPLANGSYGRSEDAIPRPKGSPAKPELIETSRKSAELIKYAANAFLSMKISFINAVANFCEAIGADVQDVARGVGADNRIGPAFLRAGLGYGGSCFPKDVAAFKTMARQWECNFALLEEVTRINEQQHHIFLAKVKNALGHLEGKRLGVLGLSFKGGTDDIRHSPAIRVVKSLLRENCSVVAYDPAATERAKTEVLSKGISYVHDAYSAARNADALLILTDWEEFARLDLKRVRGLLSSPVIVDGRNLYDPKKVAAQGLSYYSVGRPHAIHELPAEDRPAERIPATATLNLGSV